MSTITTTPFEAEHLRSDETIEVRLRGELDVAAGPELWSCLAPVLEAGGVHLRTLVLDLSALDFMDAAGLGVIMRLANKLRSTGGSICIRSPRPLVRRVLDLTDVGQVLHVEPEPV
ncbi:MAG: STAS domain-containing protein [Actinobacteria bacterium]|nr:STAS domain-containing protein [Actinomycetota bacterium]